MEKKEERGQLTLALDEFEVPLGPPERDGGQAVGGLRLRLGEARAADSD